MSIRLEKAITNLKNNWYQDELNNYAESFGVDNPESISLDDLQESNYKDLRSLISCQDEVKKLREELVAYQKAYNIFMDYWDSFSDDIKEELDESLQEIKL